MRPLLEVDGHASHLRTLEELRRAELRRALVRPRTNKGDGVAVTQAPGQLRQRWLATLERLGDERGNLVENRAGVVHRDPVSVSPLEREPVKGDEHRDEADTSRRRARGWHRDRQDVGGLLCKTGTQVARHGDYAVTEGAGLHGSLDGATDLTRVGDADHRAALGQVAHPVARHVERVDGLGRHAGVPGEGELSRHA